jgi:tungstate transport system substrate-binding protein
VSRLKLAAIAAFALLAITALSACSDGNELILATTTSTQDSGLLDILVPRFEDEYGYSVKTIAVGSGQALEMGQNGDADVLLVHSPRAEGAFMAAGHGVDRQLVMHNDFVIVGPADDPAGISNTEWASDALAAISENGALFVSRGDESGTHTRELSLWESAGVEPSGDSYQETGQGMGATLNVASEKGGYTLTDRGTYLAQKDNLDLEVLFEGDWALFNIYHVIVVNPDKGGINGEGARDFASFITRANTQALILDFGVDQYGEPLFIPEASVENPSPAGQP